MKNVITIFAAAILIVAAFLFGKSCNKCAVYSSAEVDSVVAIQKNQAAEYKWFKDSIQGHIRLNEAAIAELSGQLVQTKKEVVKSKQSASYWSGLYRKSIAAKDTPKAVIACDELQQEFEGYLIKTDAYIAKSDSIINYQNTTISMQLSLIDKQRAHIRSQDTALQMVYSQNNSLAADITKLQKKVKKAKRWGNVKTIAAGVGGAFLGTQIK
jgi:uncharacterized coiled-coil protein SlyX